MTAHPEPSPSAKYRWAPSNLVGVYIPRPPPSLYISILHYYLLFFLLFFVLFFLLPGRPSSPSLASSLLPLLLFSSSCVFFLSLWPPFFSLSCVFFPPSGRPFFPLSFVSLVPVGMSFPLLPILPPLSPRFPLGAAEFSVALVHKKHHFLALCEEMMFFGVFFFWFFF